MKKSVIALTVPFFAAALLTACGNGEDVEEPDATADENGEETEENMDDEADDDVEEAADPAEEEEPEIDEAELESALSDLDGVEDVVAQLTDGTIILDVTVSDADVDTDALADDIADEADNELEDAYTYDIVFIHEGEDIDAVVIENEDLDDVDEDEDTEAEEAAEDDE
ncbi:hypothetical protein B0H94_10419 [Salsuginibacillus halophilus]|uniref:YusW-like protein n=1 Tax=Salsuginibacillus halophilus TaxID=517424 RepID=A0A2P8HQC7_9BACI|nr:hypothetical protein [Salsuginibacillus halophilus]PSL48419.1 hypothetical protein B0H94_10419 [Salsuginibacillus halophilus]